jgi:hypothetical protein
VPHQQRLRRRTAPFELSELATEAAGSPFLGPTATRAAVANRAHLVPYETQKNQYLEVMSIFESIDLERSQLSIFRASSERVARYTIERSV